MPELPEVETIRRDLEKVLVGRAVASVDLRDPRLIAADRFHAFARAVVGQRWMALGRHGKYLWSTLENGRRIVFHLRMTGQLVLETQRPKKLYRLAFEFDDGRRLTFYDQRRFGEVWLLGPDDPWPGATTPGPDAWTELDAARLREILRGRATKIQPLLLDQRRVAGLGNIYAQEALFKASIRPSRPAKRITADEATRLFDAIRSTLESALEHRGSTSRNYLDAHGRKGSAQTLHAVYRKGGRPCPRCRHALRAARIGGRGTVYCPRCQR